MSRIAAVFRGAWSKFRTGLFRDPEDLKLQQLKQQLEERKAQLESLQHARAQAEAQERRQLAAMLDGVLDRQQEMHQRRASELEGLDPEFLVQPGEEHGAAAAAEAARVERARRSVVEAEADALLSLLGRRGFQVQGGEDAALASLQATDASEAGVTPVPAADRHGAGEAGLHAEGEADRHAAGGAAGQATAVKAPSVEPAEADVAAPSPGGRLP